MQDKQHGFGVFAAEERMGEKISQICFPGFSLRRDQLAERF
ncbi:hypothetical protein [Rhizobium sp. BK379]|nr:hypothetical protein [Rhizobium sp. BK379]MBB3444471.1 hypothetical protein [Rhizobium sp. BK379]